MFIALIPRGMVSLQRSDMLIAHVARKSFRSGGGTGVD